MAIKDENFIVFKIKNNKDIKQMQSNLNKLNMSEEKKYIALEFAENMVEASLTGSIKINDVYIVNIVKSKIKTNIESLRNVIDKVKKMKRDNMTGIVSENDIENYRGKGLLSILYADWDLNIQEDNKDFSIIARKNSIAIV